MPHADLYTAISSFDFAARLAAAGMSWVRRRYEPPRGFGHEPGRTPFSVLSSRDTLYRAAAFGRHLCDLRLFSFSLYYSTYQYC